MNKNFPFFLNIVLFTIGAALAHLAGRAAQKRAALSSEVGL
jgi:hypothetical protein